jgi:hypothetical protein
VSRTGASMESDLKVSSSRPSKPNTALGDWTVVEVTVCGAFSLANLGTLGERADACLSAWLGAVVILLRTRSEVKEGGGRR